MVTHDKDIAKRGSRVITLSDGEIVGMKENIHA
jgi:ABC-type lipoprotein export system ATPase subunit